MDKIKMVQPQVGTLWVRLLHQNGKFAGEFDAKRGVIRFVDRGGTITYDLAAEMDKVRQDKAASDTTAITPG